MKLWQLSPKNWLSHDQKYILINKYKDKDIDDHTYQVGLLDLEFPTESEKQLDNYKLRRNEIDYKLGKIDEYTFELKKESILIKDELEFKKKKLDIDYKFEKVSQIDYMKDKATFNNEPFVAMKPNYDDTTGDEFCLEIECNDLFLEKLKSIGYSGDTKEELLDQWLKYQVVNSFDNLDEIINNELPTNIRKFDIDNSGKKIYT